MPKPTTPLSDEEAAAVVSEAGQDDRNMHQNIGKQSDDVDDEEEEEEEEGEDDDDDDDDDSDGDSDGDDNSGDENVVDALEPATRASACEKTANQPPPTQMRTAHHDRVSASLRKLPFRERFVVGGVIGQGGYAKVRLAADRTTGHKVALKIVDKLTVPRSYLEKFLPREIEVMKGLDHINITKLLDVFEDDEHIVLVLELATRGDMLEFINKRGHLSEAQARGFVTQIAAALAYCHRKRVVHRDLKCENILLGDNLQIKLSDFGFATTVLAPEACVLRTHCGSFAYAAPEILAGDPYSGYQTDMWSLGVVLYAMVCGRLPYSESSPKILLTQMSRPLEFPPYVSHECRSVLRRLLDLRPGARLTAAGLLRHLWLQPPHAEEICHRPRPRPPVAGLSLNQKARPPPPLPPCTAAQPPSCVLVPAPQRADTLAADQSDASNWRNGTTTPAFIAAPATAATNTAPTTPMTTASVTDSSIVSTQSQSVASNARFATARARLPAPPPTTLARRHSLSSTNVDNACKVPEQTGQAQYLMQVQQQMRQQQLKHHASGANSEAPPMPDPQLQCRRAHTQSFQVQLTLHRQKLQAQQPNQQPPNQQHQSLHDNDKNLQQPQQQRQQVYWRFYEQRVRHVKLLRKLQMQCQQQEQANQGTVQRLHAAPDCAKGNGNPSGRACSSTKLSLLPANMPLLSSTIPPSPSPPSPPPQSLPSSALTLATAASRTSCISTVGSKPSVAVVHHFSEDVQPLAPNRQPHACLHTRRSQPASPPPVRARKSRAASSPLLLLPPVGKAAAARAAEKAAAIRRRSTTSACRNLLL